MTETQRVRRMLFRAVQNCDRHIPPSHPVFRAGMVLAGVFATASTDPSVVAPLVGYSEAFCAAIIAQLRKQRIVRGGSLRARWMKEEYGDLAFLLDAMAASGEIVRGGDPEVRKRRRARYDAGLCTSCKQPRDTDGRMCQKCRAYHADRQKRVGRSAPTTELGTIDGRPESWYGLPEWKDQ